MPADRAALIKRYAELTEELDRAAATVVALLAKSEEHQSAARRASVQGDPEAGALLVRARETSRQYFEAEDKLGEVNAACVAARRQLEAAKVAVHREYLESLDRTGSLDN